MGDKGVRMVGIPDDIEKAGLHVVGVVGREQWDWCSMLLDFEGKKVEIWVKVVEEGGED